MQRYIWFGSLFPGLTLLQGQGQYKKLTIKHMVIIYIEEVQNTFTWLGYTCIVKQIRQA